MSTRSRLIEVEIAEPGDGFELLKLLEDSSFKGNICLLYTRRPDAYGSLQREGKHVEVECGTL